MSAVNKLPAPQAAPPAPLPPGVWREPGGVATRLSEEMLRRLLVARPGPDLPAPFGGIKTKPDDLWSVALLHGWAEVLDILAFYQTHILGEGYIGTATEPLSRQLLRAQLGLERGRRSALAAAPKPGAPQPIVLDPGCAATADFIFGLRPAPGLPPVTVLPAGAQLRRHSIDAPNVMIFETERAVSLRADWADLPLAGLSVAPRPLVSAGAAGVLTDRRDVAPAAGDRMLLTDRDNPAVWTRRTVTAVSANAKAGLCEVAFDAPLATAIPSPQALVYTRRTPLFGWNAADFSSLPVATRLAAVRGKENTLSGGVRVMDGAPTTKLNGGLSAAAPRAVGVGPDGTVYLAADDGLYWAPRGTEAWRQAPGSAAVRDIGVMTVAPDGLLMLGGASGNVWVGRDPAAGFDNLVGGYVLEADPPPLKAPRPIKATLPGGPARALFAVGDPTSRVLAQTDAGLFEYDPKGFWLSVSAAPLGLHPLEHDEPIQTRLNGKRLAACVVSADRHFAILAYGLEVEIVRLGRALPPPAPVAGGAGTKAPEPATPPSPEKQGWGGGLLHWVEGLFGHGHPTPSPPVPRKAPHRSGAWLFDSPVLALAPLASAGGHGWSSFLAADANGVYRVDWDGQPVPAGGGLPPGPVTRFTVQPDGANWIVRVALPTGVYRFDPKASTWGLEVPSETGGPVVAAATGGRMVVAEPMLLPGEWPGFVLADGASSVDLAGQGLDLAHGEIIVLTSPTDGARPAVVESATPMAVDAFGLRERIVRVVFRWLPQTGLEPVVTALSRRTTVVDILGRAVRLVSPADARRLLLGPGAELSLQGDWDDLGQPRPQDVGPVLPTSGVAGGDRRALPPDLGAMLAWGGQPMDMSGIAARAASPGSDVVADAPRLAVIGARATITPKPLGGVLSLGAQQPERSLAGLDVRGLAMSGANLLAATAGQGVFRQIGAAGPWSALNAGLTAGGLTVTAIATDASGAVVIATGDGVHRLEPGGTAWSLIGPPPSPDPVTVLCLLPSGVVMAGGKAGVFALVSGTWAAALGGVMPTATPISALAAWEDGCLAAPVPGGLIFAGADHDWSVWSASLAVTRVQAIRPDGAGLFAASDSGLFSATATGATRLLLDLACDAVDVSGDALLVGVAGDGAYLSTDGGTDWRRLSPGLSNALTAVALCGPTDPRAAAGTGMNLRADAGTTAWTPAPTVAVLPATLTAALDAGLTLPLKAALPTVLAKAAPDGAVTAVVTPGSAWTFGAPGQGPGQGAMLLALRTDGIAVSTPTDLFVVETAEGSGPTTLALAATLGQGRVEAWLDDLIVVPSNEPAITQVGSIESATAGPGGTQVVLDKALGVLLDAAGVTCTANVVTASQGETVAGEILGDGDAGRVFQTFALRRAPLTFVEGQDGVSRPVLSVYVNGVEWSPVSSLVGAGPSDRVYMLKIGSGDRGEISFGDGVTGARLPNGRGNVTATYRTGMAPIQTLEAGVTTLLMARPSVSRIDGVIRTPGRAPVTGEAQARAVQASLRSLGRLVTAGDYATFLETFTQVGSATVDEIEARGRPLLYVTVALAGGQSAETLGFSLDQAKRAVAAAQAIPAPPFEIGLAGVSRVRVAATLWIKASARAADVKAAAETAVANLLGPGAPLIGQARRLAEVEDALQRVPGVAGVSVDAFYIAGRSRRANLRLEASRARRLPSGRYAPAAVLVLDTAEDAVDLTLLTAGEGA